MNILGDYCWFFLLLLLLLSHIHCYPILPLCLGSSSSSLLYFHIQCCSLIPLSIASYDMPESSKYLQCYCIVCVFSSWYWSLLLPVGVVGDAANTRPLLVHHHTSQAATSVWTQDLSEGNQVIYIYFLLYTLIQVFFFNVIYTHWRGLIKRCFRG